MTFVIFHKDTTRYLRVFRNRYWQNADYFKTERAAKAALTRAARKATDEGSDSNISENRILPYNEFIKIEKTETVHNLLTGKPVVQSVNTPACCDPSTELYHTM